MNKIIASHIKEIRVRKGFSQEELSGQSGLSLRTIQRIENGETEPHADSIKRIAHALDISPEEIIDWGVVEDSSYLMALNISALTFLLFPILGIIIPYIMWRTKKDRVKGLNKVSKDIINFQITWTLVYFLGALIIIITFINSPSLAPILLTSYIVFTAFMYVTNISLIVLNTVLIQTGKKLRYYPKISFL